MYLSFHYAGSSLLCGLFSSCGKQVLEQVMNDDPMILKDPIPKIAVKELNNSSVDFALWLWVKTDDYWTVWMRIRENIYNALYANHIEIPFPQVRVHTS